MNQVSHFQHFTRSAGSGWDFISPIGLTRIPIKFLYLATINLSTVHEATYSQAIHIQIKKHGFTDSSLPGQVRAGRNAPIELETSYFGLPTPPSKIVFI